MQLRFFYCYSHLPSAGQCPFWSRTHSRSAFTINQSVKVYACVCVTFRLGILGRSNADVGHGNVLIGITRNVTQYVTHAAFEPRNRVILVHGRISGSRVRSGIATTTYSSVDNEMHNQFVSNSTCAYTYRL